jgi:elongation factor G
VSTGIACAFWDKRKINILDTPGDSNFINDSRNCLSVADAALVVVSAVGGVEVNTEKMWGLAEEMEVPRIILINKCDRERANPAKVLQEVRDNLHAGAIQLHLPIGSESTFRGLVSVMAGKAFTYDGVTGKGTEIPVPADMKDALAAAHKNIIEAVAESDEALMEKYFETDDLPAEDVRANLPKLIQAGHIVPILYGAASKAIGTDLLLNVIVAGAPSPVDRGSRTAAKGDDEIEVAPDADAAFAGQVFKTIADPYAGRLTVFRVWRGTLQPDGSFVNTTREAKERYGQILGIFGKKQVPQDCAVAGDIVAVSKLKETKTGDTLCSADAELSFAQLEPVLPIVTFAISAEAKGDEEKMIEGLHRLAEEDPSVVLGLDEQTRDILLSGMGSVHVEVIRSRLKRKFGVSVQLALPKVPYRETIRKKVTGIEGKHKKQSGGRGQFGVCYIDMEPLPRGKMYEFEDAIFGGSIPRQFIPAVDKGLQEAMVKGPMTGCPVVDIKFRLYDGKYHNVDSSEMAFKIAGSQAFKEGFARAGGVLLEPVMNMEIVVPDECMGDVMGDVTSRRGKVQGMDAKGRYQIIRAQIPMGEVLQYAPDLNSMTSGRGTFAMEMSHYDPMPPVLAEKVMKARADEKEAAKN